MNTQKILPISITVILFILIVTLITRNGEEFVTKKEASKEVSYSTFIAPVTKAESVIVWDIKRGKAIYEKNADASKPLASIAKIMTAVTAFDLVPKNTAVSIDEEALKQYGESGLISNERWKLGDLVDFSLVESSNDGIAAVASAVGAIRAGDPDKRNAGRVNFIDLMNQKAREIGMKNTSFSNESGLDIYDESQAGAIGSAKDIALLFEYTLENHPEVLEATSREIYQTTSLSNYYHVAVNTNEAIDKIPALIGSKTGYTDISGGNLAVIIDPGINNPIVIVVLGSTFEERFSDVVVLSEATLNYLK
ncbi:MAG: hypothetical protein MRY49_00215 [Candidatus Pacebacteria bacterium]|nr:hypothetical protein [Candidatus Paceibacterota bacterium]